MRDPNNPCLFCNVSESGCAHENDLAYASYDSYPVSEHHCLIIPKRHIKDYFELTKDELTACHELIKIVKDLTSKGFVRNDYKRKLVDLSDIRINLKGKK